MLISPPYRFAAYLEQALGLTTDQTSQFFRGVLRDRLVGLGVETQAQRVGVYVE